MIKETRWNDDFKKQTLKFIAYTEKPVIIEDGENIFENYGLTTIILTDEHIKALIDGKALNFDINGSEFAGLIIHQKSLDGEMKGGEN